jgi:hypothetical protein
MVVQHYDFKVGVILRQQRATHSPMCASSSPPTPHEILGVRTGASGSRSASTPVIGDEHQARESDRGRSSKTHRPIVGLLYMRRKWAAVSAPGASGRIATVPAHLASTNRTSPQRRKPKSVRSRHHRPAGVFSSLKNTGTEPPITNGRAAVNAVHARRACQHCLGNEKRRESIRNREASTTGINA